MLACEAMIEDVVTKEMDEFNESKERLTKLTKKAAKAISEADQKARASLIKKVKVLEAMVEDNVSAEMEEFKENQVLQRETFTKKLRTIREQYAADREALIKRTAVVLESIVEDKIGGKVKELEEDIKAARRNNFGRKIFEAFMFEMRETFFNEDAEAKKLRNELNEAKSRLRKERTARIDETKKMKKQLLESKTRIKRQKASAERKTIVEGLLSKVSDVRLRKDVKEILDVTPTGSLRETFKKIVRENSQANTSRGTRKVIKEGSTTPLTFKNGNSKEVKQGDDSDVALLSLQKRAGIRVQ
jgi:tetrahydromethanopterin S-methyltransferase subunit G